MKKWLSIAVCVAMVLTLTACGGNKGNESEKIVENTSEIGQKEEQSKEKPDTSNKEGAKKEEMKTLRWSIRVGSAVYVDCPAAWIDDDNVNTRYVYKKEWFDPGTAVIGLTTYGAGEYAGDLDTVPQKIGTQFVRDVQQRCAGALHEANVEVLATESVTVNGYEGLRFTGKVFNPGKLSDKATWDCHVYGYAFIIDGTAVTVSGIVAEQEQSPELIKEVDAAVDAMAATIRTKK